MDHKRHFLRLLHGGGANRREGNARRLYDALRPQHHAGHRHQAHGLPGRLALWHHLRRVRQRQGPSEKLDRTGERRLQGHHEELQPRAMGIRRPGEPLQPLPARGLLELRDQASHLRQEADGAPGDPLEVGRNGPTSRGHSQLAGEHDSSDVRDAQRAGHDRARRPHRPHEGPQLQGLRVLCPRGPSDLRWQRLHTNRSRREGGASVQGCRSLCHSWRQRGNPAGPRRSPGHASQALKDLAL
mmetsp:Transcript_8564/g.12588  ORF Transcript_8564/g.12588 Transcript_8564/m.12588 type:complete len:242 (-) Transcript_8564:166-891(-)